MSKATKQEMTAKNEAIPQVFQDMENDQRGSENVSTADLTIPRLEIIQDLSPCRKKTEPVYIEGAESGMMYNTVTRGLVEGHVLLVPIKFVKEYLIWKDRQQGGGFFGAFPSAKEAKEELAVLEQAGETGLEVVETDQHYCVGVDETGRFYGIVLSMAKSKKKISRQWNSLIATKVGPRFACRYKVSAFLDSNRKGEYYNFRIENAGYLDVAKNKNGEYIGTDAQLYAFAEKTYDLVESGAATADRSQDITSSDGDGTDDEAF